MKNYFLLGALVLAVFLGTAKAADSVEPASLSVTNNRNDSVSYLSETVFYKNASLLWTNCTLQTTGTVVQGLSGVAIELKWGNSLSNLTFTPIVTSTNLGKWTLNMTIPEGWDMPSIQIKVTDAMSNSFIYPWRLIHVKDAM